MSCALGVSLRDFPFPYRAMVSICSDLDETPSLESYLEISRFLNTTDVTQFGNGLDLEVGNTIYFHMPEGAFSYWNTTRAGREVLRQLIRSGHIDCFHSYGDSATSRQHVRETLDDLKKHGCKLRVWIDHAIAPTNFGKDIMQGKGDVENDRAFHADLTIAHGVEFVWMGRVTSIVGQNSYSDFGSIFSTKYPLSSTVTFFKEFGKRVAGQMGSAKYEMHRSNELLRQTSLRSGQEVWEFIRSNPHACGVSVGDRGDRIAEVMTASMLNRLVQKGGVSVLYTHLGKARDEESILPEESIQALTGLAERARSKEILVTTTRRLLDYCRNVGSLRWNAVRDNGQLIFDIETGGRRADGLSFYVPREESIVVKIDGVVRNDFVMFEADHTGRAGFSIPWKKLPYPI